MPRLDYSRQFGIRRRAPDAAAVSGTRSGLSMMRAAYGDMPAVRTGLTVTLPALPDASSIWPLPEVDRDVLAAAGTPEHQVAAFGLRRRHLAPGVVLVAGVLRDQHARRRRRRTGSDPNSRSRPCRRRTRRRWSGRSACRRPTSTARPSATRRDGSTYSMACGPRTRPAAHAGRAPGCRGRGWTGTAGPGPWSPAVRLRGGSQRRVGDRQRVTGRAGADQLGQRRIPLPVIRVSRGRDGQTDQQRDRRQHRQHERAEVNETACDA